MAVVGSIRGLMQEPSATTRTKTVAANFVDALLESYTSQYPETCTPTFLRRLLLGYARELVCKEDESEGEIRLAQIRAWAQILRAVGKSPEEMQLKLIETDDRMYLKAVLKAVQLGSAAQ